MFQNALRATLRALLACTLLAAHAIGAAQQLNAAHLAVVKAAIVANPAWNGQPLNSDGSFAIAAAMNQAKTPTQLVWHTAAPVDDLIDSIAWASYTPTDKIGASDTDPLSTVKVARLLEIQVKQMNLQLMLQGRATINCARATLRAGLRDAVIQVPSGAAGAATAPGGSNGTSTLTRCTRAATVIEDLLAGAAETTGAVTAKVMVFEGLVSYQDIDAARALP